MSLAFAEHDVAVWQGDAREQLTLMPAGSVQCALSSPPYFGLRDYGTGRWEGGGGDCDHKPRKDPTRNIATSTLGGSKGTVGDQQKGYHGRCSRCGAHRVDEQLGLESSPAEYVARMVAVFAEVRRVLAADGVLWLNLGDSYYSGRGNPGPNSADEKQEARRGWVRALDRPGQDWGQPKNLLGVPWMVAKALQQPRYVGKIASEVDRAWLAAMLDGEGCIAVHRRPAGSSPYRRNDTYGPMVQITNTCLPLLARCQQIAGVGSISQSDRGRNRRIYRYCVMANDARQLLRELYPHLIAKQPQARAAVAMPSSGPDAERAWLECKALNRGGTHDGDWPAPASLHDPGWILRNAVVWAKPNAMPESVTDRLSTRYELVFLFSKSRRYWFDLDPIREAYEPAGIACRAYPFSASDNYGGDRPAHRAGMRPTNDIGKNPGDVWTIPTAPFPGAHFACMPPALAERCIKAGCPPGGTVLDPFAGSGTTLAAARKLGRKSVGIELNPDYIDLIRARIGQAPLEFEAAAPVAEPCVVQDGFDLGDGWPA